MDTIIETIIKMLLGGLFSLADYLSLHVLLCLIPAFFIAGAMVVFIPQDIIVKYMGKDSPRYIAYPVASISGLLLAVCSCTVLPLFAGIKKKGAGLGPAMTFLFAAPAINILAITYTGVLIGMDIAISRAVLAIVFSIIIGLLMEFIFREKKTVENKMKEDIIEEGSSTKLNDTKDERVNLESKEKERSVNWNKAAQISLVSIFLVISVSLAVLNEGLLLRLGIVRIVLVQSIIWGIGIVLLITSMLFIKNITLNIFLGLLYFLFTGTSQISYFDAPPNEVSESALNRSLEYFLSESYKVELLNMIMKAVLAIVVVIIIAIYSFKKLKREDLRYWMEETWDFVKKIFPILILGVFLAGFIGVLIPKELIQSLVGRNTVVANFIGAAFGIIAYFPTLLEVPIARLFLDLGMARGVLLTYLLADPELSIQSILVTRRFIGNGKTAVYVGLVTIFTVLAGLLFGLLIANEGIAFI